MRVSGRGSRGCLFSWACVPASCAADYPDKEKRGEARAYGGFGEGYVGGFQKIIDEGADEAEHGEERYGDEEVAAGEGEGGCCYGKDEKGVYQGFPPVKVFLPYRYARAGFLRAMRTWL